MNFDVIILYFYPYICTEVHDLFVLLSIYNLTICMLCLTVKVEDHYDDRWTTRSPHHPDWDATEGPIQHIALNVVPANLRVSPGQTAEFRCEAVGGCPHLQYVSVF